jgi:hypothetical protein
MRRRRHTRTGASQQKEAELQQLQSEIEAPRLTADSLSEDGGPDSESAVELTGSPAPDPHLRKASSISFP